MILKMVIFTFHRKPQNIPSNWYQFQFLPVILIEATPMNSPKIRGAILDDNANLRRSLGKLLGKEPDICVVAEAETGAAGIKKVEEHNPDVILMDNNKPFTDGLEATTMIVSKFQDTRVIVLSRDSGSTMTASACLSGACYPLCQDCSTEGILSAIREGHHPV
jgi:DNA-binding NarL/FixJ family response regulator